MFFKEREIGEEVIRAVDCGRSAVPAGEAVFLCPSLVPRIAQAAGCEPGCRGTTEGLSP
jgi:hypothetical protein